MLCCAPELEWIVDEMILRYSRPDMVALWAAEERFRIWFEIEAHAADALADIVEEAARGG